MSENGCGCTCTPDAAAVAALVKSALLDQINAGSIQQALVMENGASLNRATMLTAAEVRSLVELAISGESNRITALSDKVSDLSDMVEKISKSSLTGVSHDDTLGGDGTASSPLRLAVEGLKRILGSIFQMDGAATPADVTVTKNVASTIIGGTDATMGKPVGFIPVPGANGYGIPLYGIKG